MDKIWYRDLSAFVSTKRLVVFVPTSSMTLVQKLNAMMRFSIYLAIILQLVKNDVLVWYIPIGMAIFTVFMSEFYDKSTKLQRELYDKVGVAYDRRTEKLCSKPTPNNPFMNVLMNEYTDFPNRPSACDLNSNKVSKAAESYFDHNLYRDVDDVWSRKAGSRNWHTVPVTTIPNDAVGFAKSLYQNKTTCKSGDGNKCYTNLYRPYNI